ncbi:MAG: M13 family metallopeptidase [Ferruginibacter sp.]
MKKYIPLLMLTIIFTTFSSKDSAGQSKPSKRKYIDKANMDLSVKPGDNFFQYANGTWLKQNPVPASKTRWGSFDLLRDESSARLKDLLLDASANKSPDRATGMIGNFYANAMDSIAIEAKGFQPIQQDLDRIASISDTKGIINEIATLRTTGRGATLFTAGVGQDSKNVNKYIPQVGQGGTTLPDRDYYLNDDSRSKTIRSAYMTYLQKMFAMVGRADAVNASDAVMRIETALAKAQMSRVEMRDPYKTYNKFSVKDLSAITPGLDWSMLLLAMKINGADSLLVNNPSFLKTADILLSAVSLNDWKSYLQWNIIKNTAPYLSSSFVNQSFQFNKVLSGQKEQTPRWERMSGLIDGSLGDLLGQLYVSKYFKPEAKVRMQELVKNLQNTFESRIQQLNWMSSETKTKALEKLHAFTNKIAYPDKWKTYDGVVIDKNDFVGNVLSTRQWAYNYMVNRMGQPVDRTQWGMTPSTINAYYSPSNNEIVFPAAILQFPFFDFGADDAINYGGIGAVIGHEMTHGFDDQGRQYGADGNLKEWWTKDDGDMFKMKADKIVNQYNSFTVQDSIYVNGRLTLGENLADLGGLSIAYEAYTKTKEFKSAKMIDGFTPTQRFFLSWAQIWRSNVLPETAAQLILTDSHSPGMFRSNGPLTNMDVWYNAFNVKAGDKMYKAPEDRIYVW